MPANRPFVGAAEGLSRARGVFPTVFFHKSCSPCVLLPPLKRLMKPAQLAPLLIIPLIAWRMYARVRRSIGRQPLQPKRMVVRIAIFGLISLLIGAGAWANTRLLSGLLGGLFLGVPLALLGLRLTKFEITPVEKFYTPNTVIGVTLSALFIGRVIYRIIVLSDQTGGNPTSPEIFQSPLTLSVFGLTAGYYIAYYTGVLRRARGSQ